MIWVETGAGFETQPRANFLLNFRIEKRKRAHRAADFSNRHSFARPLQAFSIAAHLVVPEREGQSEGSRLGVDAVRAANLRRVLELKGAAS